MYQHGGDIYSNDVMLDFSVSLNPCGMPGSVSDAIKIHVHDYETYPDYDCRKLRECISKLEGVDIENILCGNGAADLIYHIINASQPKRALLAVPSFLEYERALRAYECEIDYFYLRRENDFNLEKQLEEFLKQLEAGYDVAFVCNPNNPSGNLLSPEAIKKIADKCREENVLLILDQCFAQMCGQKSMAGQLTDNEKVVILNAFTKTFSMAGVRLGYLVTANCDIIKNIKNKRQSWSVSGIAQVAGIAAAGEQEYLSKSIKVIKKEREFLSRGLEKLGFKVYPGSANFILFENIFDDSELKSIDFKEKLLENQIMIRSCSNFVGLTDSYYRVAVKNHVENKILLLVLKMIIRKVK